MFVIRDLVILDIDTHKQRETTEGHKILILYPYEGEISSTKHVLDCEDM
jgi:hypothetical protein